MASALSLHVEHVDHVIVSIMGGKHRKCTRTQKTGENIIALVLGIAQAFHNVMDCQQRKPALHTIMQGRHASTVIRDSRCGKCGSMLDRSRRDTHI